MRSNFLAHRFRVRVPMVDIRKVRMAMVYRLMLVGVCVGLVTPPVKIVAVLVVCIVAMRMCMGHWRVLVRMHVVFSQVQPDTGSHDGCCQPKHWACGLTQQDNRQHSTHEWSGREIGSGSGGAQTAKCQNK